MCLDLTDDEDDIIPGRSTMTHDATGKLIKENKDQNEEEELEDGFLENVLVGLWNIMLDALDIEKLLFIVFFNHFRRLKQAGKLIQWFCIVTVPLYAGLFLLNLLVTLNMESYSNYQLLAVDMVLTVAVPLTILSFAYSVLQFPHCPVA